MLASPPVHPPPPDAVIPPSAVSQAEQVQHTRDWTTGMASFDQILSGLKEVSAAKRPAAQSASEQSSGSLQQASAGKQRAAKALKKRKAPCPSTSSASSSSGDDEQASGSASSSSDDEQAAPVAAKRVKLASHVGRYMKRERGKTVKNYSASDLDAILGGKGASAAAEQQPQDDDCDGQAGAGAFPKFAEVRAAPRTSSGSASSGGSDADDEQEEDGDAGDSNAAANRKLSGKAASSTKRCVHHATPATMWVTPNPRWQHGCTCMALHTGSCTCT